MGEDVLGARRGGVQVQQAVQQDVEDREIDERGRDADEPEGEDLRRLNRLLLEAAYPNELLPFSRWIVETAREHYRALPIRRSGLKAALYKGVFRPLYNLLPRALAESLAYKYSVVAVKR